jgi:hypothetical protein
MTFTLQPMRVATGFDEEGMLVLDEKSGWWLCWFALPDDNEVTLGQWHSEAGFGQIDGINHPTFSNLDIDQDRISQRLAKRRYRLAPEQLQVS